MKVYTRTGDKGTTSLVGGTRVAKDNHRLEAYGTIDELNSHLGLLTTSQHVGDSDRSLILEAQARLLDIGACLATEADSKYAEMTSNPVDDTDIHNIEMAIDRLNDTLPALKTFVLPGGTTDSANAHIARTICRRAERRIISLSAECEVDPAIVAYVNRMSDYLFVLARAINNNADVPDPQWTPRKRLESTI